MKRKISKILGVGLALVLVLSFSLVAAVPVAASPDVSDVRVELSNYLGSQSSDYHIYFTPSVDLAADVDTITILLPVDTTGISSITNAADGDVVVDEDGDAIWVAPDATNAASEVAGYRLVVTTPVDISAGTEARIDILGALTNPTTEGPYQVTVWTSQETTHVDSASYTIGATSVTVTGFGPADNPDITAADPGLTTGTVGLTDDYVVLFDTTNTLAANWGTITVTFPPTTTVPTAISADSVYVSPDTTTPPTYQVCTEAPVVDGRSVTVKTPAEITGGNSAGVYFTPDAGIKNPTRATDGNNTADATDYVGKVRTSEDTGVQHKAFDGACTINAASASGLSFDPDSADSVLVNAASGDINVRSIDVYGNFSEVPILVAVDLSSSSTTGLFYDVADSDNTFDDDTVEIAKDAYEGTFQHKDTTVGTATITASYGSWTPVNWAIEVLPEPVVELYDGEVLVGTYTTIGAAVDSALEGNTIKVGPGTYTEDVTVDTVDHLTIQSTDGAASTIWKGQNCLTINGVDYTTIGGEGKGFTFESSGVAASHLISLHTDPQYTTIQYNTIDCTGLPSRGITMNADTSNLTVSHNTFILDSDDQGIRTNQGPNIKVIAASISYNTFTGPGNTEAGSAIEVGTNIAASATAITENTISDHGYGIVLREIKGDATASAPLDISNNTISGCYQGIDIRGATNAAEDQRLYISNNTLSNNTYGIGINKCPDAWKDGTEANLDPTDWVIKFNSFSGNTDYGLYNNVLGTDVDASHNWWGDDTGPGGEGPGMGDAISADVIFEPWVNATASAADVAKNASSLDARTTVGVKVAGVDGFDATTVIGAALYTANPKATPEFSPLENGFFDVFVKNPGADTSEIGIKFYANGMTSDSRAYVWDAFEEVWKECSNQAYNATYGYIWVKVHQAGADVPTMPTISDLAGIPFAIGTAAPAVTLESIAASPSSVSLNVDGTQQLTVTATYSDASEADVTADATYVSDNETVATVSTGGLITGVAEGSAAVTVSYTEGGITKTDTVSVTVSGVFDPWSYDADEDGAISKTEALTAVTDYFAGVITKAQALEVIALYFAS